MTLLALRPMHPKSTKAFAALVLSTNYVEYPGAAITFTTDTYTSACRAGASLCNNGCIFHGHCVRNSTEVFSLFGIDASTNSELFV